MYVSQSQNQPKVGFIFFVFLPKFSVMKKTALTFLLAIVSIIVQAQIPNGYYDNAAGKTGDELKTALHSIIAGHTSISYQQIWSAFWSTDNKGNNVVWDMYSDGAGYIYHYDDNDQCGSYNSEGDCFNREHSWPQSWFSNASTPTTDLHHIFPTDGFVNQQRSNYPFGEVQTASWASQNGSKLGTCKSSLGYNGTVFEPIDEYKGDFARALMYMSVRYYGEDSSWGTSGMTNKSIIKDWAINMLMNWSDNDPVSQKEIDRNNVVYGIQSNRNPFIDHPEYARAIWDPNWTGVEYNISYASVQHGNISGPATAVKGTMVTLSATPDEGYMIDSWSVYKTGDTGTTVNINSDGTFTMPAFNVTVSVNFVQNTAYYTITKGSVSHGSFTVSATSAQSGTTITLSNTPDNGYTLYSYYVYKTDDISTIVYSGENNTFVMPAYNVTVTASFVQPSSYSYVKVTSEPSDWSGEYLIVYESGNKAFNGALTTLDAAENTISVTISNNSIASSTTIDAATFTIAKSDNNYTIQSASGYYIGRTASSNGMNTSTNQQYTNTISISNGSAAIAGSGGPTLQFNSTSGQNRFRYFTSTQQPIQLYKRIGSTSTPTHTIQFNPNGGSQSSYNQIVNEFEVTALQPNSFTREGFEFNSWNTEENGTGTTYFDGSTVSLLDDLTLYAQWKQIFTINLEDSPHGNVTASQTQAIEGDLITLTVTPDQGYELDALTVTDSYSNTIPVTDNQFEMPASNVTVSANFTPKETFTAHYYLVTSTDQLIAGRTYLIVNMDYNKALGLTQNTNNRSAASVTIEDNMISTPGNACELILGGQSGAWTLYDASNNGYLYAAGGTGNNNYLKTQATLSNEGKWTITFNNNSATIKTIVTTVARHTIMYNNGNNIFSCYASGQQNVCLFIRSEAYDHTSSESIKNLFVFDKHIIRAGATLTVTNTATCNDPNLLIIEDGAQFIHHNNDLKATMKKDIAAYSGDGGWYTIATPFVNYNPIEITTNSYDLYAYNESADQEWMNYKANSFNMTSSSGYLYAHNPSTTLRMTGTLTNGDYSKAVELSYENSEENLRGFNLLGNPTAHDITFISTSAVSDGYYYLSNHDEWKYSTTNNVPVGRGFLVKANAEGQTVTLNPQSKGESMVKEHFISLDIDGDKAYVKMTGGVSMPMLNFQGKSSSVYLTRDGQAYTMLVRDNAESIDLCYRPIRHSKHTLSVTANGVDYLHLIDHKTGTDIDLIATPNYSFESTSSDYTSRFQLKFNADSDSDSDLFAYYSDGRIVVNGEGTLHIFDITGRKVENSHLAPGVYILRLTTPERVKTQKLVID